MGDTNTLGCQALALGHSPVFIVSEAHLMGFELRNKKLENFEEYEEIDLENKKTDTGK